MEMGVAQGRGCKEGGRKPRHRQGGGSTPSSREKPRPTRLPLAQAVFSSYPPRQSSWAELTTRRPSCSQPKKV